MYTCPLVSSSHMFGHIADIWEYHYLDHKSLHCNKRKHQQSSYNLSNKYHFTLHDSCTSSPIHTRDKQYQKPMPVSTCACKTLTRQSIMLLVLQSTLLSYRVAEIHSTSIMRPIRTRVDRVSNRDRYVHPIRVGKDHFWSCLMLDKGTLTSCNENLSTNTPSWINLWMPMQQMSGFPFSPLEPSSTGVCSPLTSSRCTSKRVFNKIFSTTTVRKPGLKKSGSSSLNLRS